MESIKERKAKRENLLIKEQYKEQGIDVDIGKEQHSLKYQILYSFIALLILSILITLCVVYKNDLIFAYNLFIDSIDGLENLKIRIGR